MASGLGSGVSNLLLGVVLVGTLTWPVTEDTKSEMAMLVLPGMQSLLPLC